MQTKRLRYILYMAGRDIRKLNTLREAGRNFGLLLIDEIQESTSMDGHVSPVLLATLRRIERGEADRLLIRQAPRKIADKGALWLALQQGALKGLCIAEHARELIQIVHHPDKGILRVHFELPS